MNPDGEGFEARYEEYELPSAARNSLKQIKEHLERGYTDEQLCRAHINYLEGLCSRVKEIIQAEQSHGYSNETLKHDYKRMDALCRQVTQVLDQMDN